jgi:hypothetical protein
MSQQLSRSLYDQGPRSQTKNVGGVHSPTAVTTPDALDEFDKAVSVFREQRVIARPLQFDG